jgi:hypothetical protein
MNDNRAYHGHGETRKMFLSIAGELSLSQQEKHETATAIS